ncbi:MAG TPA: hypothetical protein VN224_01265 [Xanthomonadales bacterium]|nr:hypothetical protein [Xanthomonadales bacterium]
MRAGERTRRDWAIALAASVLIHALALGFVRFAPVPSTDAADDATPVAILRITKRVSYAHGRRGGAAPAPSASHAKPNRSSATVKIARGASAPGSKRASTTAAARPAGEVAAQPRARAAATRASDTSGTAPATGAEAMGARASAAGAQESPGPAPTITAEMLASLNQRMHDAIPSTGPQTMKRYTTDMGALAVHPDPNRWTVATYPLPQRGLFAHAIIVRVGREAVAVRAIQRIGNAYICIGYLAKIDEHNPDATLAGPYIGPCKKARREQLGLVPKPSPSPAPAAGQSE